MKTFKPHMAPNPFLKPYRDRSISKEEIDNAILNRAKKWRQTIHGSYALKQQIGEYAREPHDIDILTKNPEYHMNKMEDDLDLMAGYDAYYENVMPIIGTEGEYVYKVMKKVYGPDIDIVDYFKPKKGVKTRKIKGILYEDWKYAKKILIDIVNNPELRHRHGKAMEDLRRIEAYERSLK
jgi:hypothetical protein